MKMRKGIIAILLVAGVTLTGCSGNEYNGIKYSLKEDNTLIKNDEFYLSLYENNDELMKFLLEKDLLPKTQTEFRLSGPNNKVTVRVHKGLINKELAYRVLNPQMEKDTKDETLLNTYYKVNNGKLEKIELETVALYGFDGNEDGKFDDILYDIEPAPTSLDVRIEESMEKENGKIRFNIKTNLPDTVELMVGISEVSNGDYSGQSKSIVKNGEAQTEWFSNKGEALRNGEYKLSISMSLPKLQPKSVQDVVGVNGEFMEGKHVKKAEIGEANVVSMEKTITLDGGASGQDKVTSNNNHKELVAVFYNELISEYNTQLSGYNELEFGKFIADWNRRRNEAQAKMDKEDPKFEYALAMSELIYLETELKNKLAGKQVDDNFIKETMTSIESAIK